MQANPNQTIVRPFGRFGGSYAVGRRGLLYYRAACIMAVVGILFTLLRAMLLGLWTAANACLLSMTIVLIFCALTTRNGRRVTDSTA